LDDIQIDAKRRGIVTAIKTGDTPRIFDWAMENFSYQGISDQVARNYLAKHGGVTWRSIEAGLKKATTCPKLQSYWQFDRCRYDKGSFSCAEPEHIETCPLPGHRLRNGRLNQTAYSFFLFVRDIAHGDLVGWIDHQLASGHGSAPPLQEALIGPLRQVHGLSDKILTMTLSTLLTAAPTIKPDWFEVGKGMIAVDTLVHNFLHRTGVLADFEATHAYGPGCYASGGCAEIIRSVSAAIDATNFNRSFPNNFPRFVQHAIWRFCAGGGLNICNGNQIDDRKPCESGYCQLFRICQKFPLKPQ
jgi:hypothetical protein